MLLLNVISLMHPAPFVSLMFKRIILFSLVVGFQTFRVITLPFLSCDGRFSLLCFCVGSRAFGHNKIYSLSESWLISFFYILAVFAVFDLSGIFSVFVESSTKYNSDLHRK